MTKLTAKEKAIVRAAADRIANNPIDSLDRYWEAGITDTRGRFACIALKRAGASKSLVRRFAQFYAQPEGYPWYNEEESYLNSMGYRAARSCRILALLLFAETGGVL